MKFGVCLWPMHSVTTYPSSTKLVRGIKGHETKGLATWVSPPPSIMDSEVPKVWSTQTLPVNVYRFVLLPLVVGDGRPFRGLNCITTKRPSLVA